MCRFKHSGDLGELERLWEVCKLVGGHHQIGAQSFEDVVAINAEEFFIEVAMEGPSLRVELVITSGFGHRNGTFVIMALRMVGVPVFMSGAFFICFAVSRGAVDADVEDCATPERQERRLLGEGLGEGLRGALRLGVRIFLKDSLEGCSGTPAGVQHVDDWWELIGDLVGEFAP